MDKPQGLEEKTLSSKRIFEGRVLTIDILKIELPDGSRSTREIVRHGGAVAILGELPDGRFVFVYQYRKAVEDTLLECVAGCMEQGETPEESARRETKEETGYDVASVTSLGLSLPSPGYCEEHHYLFHAMLKPTQSALQLDSDENLRPVILTADEIDTAIANGDLIDGKSVIIWHKYQIAKKALCT